MSFKSDFEASAGWNVVDTNVKLHLPARAPFVRFLKDQGVHTIIRYYARSQSNSKTLSQSEAKFLSKEGFSILPIFQQNARLTTDFGAANGKLDAAKAVEFSALIGQPLRTTILFAVDVDFDEQKITEFVVPYFKAVNEEVAGKFKIGAYGSGLSLQTLLDQELIDVPWLSMSRLFRGTKEFFYAKTWAVRQLPPDLTHSGTGVTYDRNISTASSEALGTFKIDTDRGNQPSASMLFNAMMSEDAAGAKYPGSPISETSGDSGEVVKYIQSRLNVLGFGPIRVDGDFGSITRNTIRDFQALNDNNAGHALDVTGIVDEQTWQALFGGDATVEKPVPDVRGISSEAEAFVTILLSQEGVKEDPPRRNRGPRIDAYISSTELNPGSDSLPWCVAYIYWCAMNTSEQKNIANPFPKTAGVKRLWQLGKRIATEVVESDVASSNTVKPGMVFFIDTGENTGHAGVVTKVGTNFIETIEGNTNAGGSRDGYGVFRRRRALNMSSLIGYMGFWKS